MKVFLIRHGESIGNIKEIIQTAEEPLTKKGVLQVKNLKKKIEDIKFDLVFSSDMKRAIETTKILFWKQNIPIIYTKNLEEKRNGNFEGLKKEEINWKEINKKPFETRKAPNGENLIEVKKRVEEFLKLIRKLNCERIAIISHGTIIRIILSIIMKKDLEGIIMNRQLKNCEIIEIKI
jgi:broad specificity phosphatase PhoE